MLMNCRIHNSSAKRSYRNSAKQQFMTTAPDAEQISPVSDTDRLTAGKGMGCTPASGTPGAVNEPPIFWKAQQYPSPEEQSL